MRNQRKQRSACLRWTDTFPTLSVLLRLSQPSEPSLFFLPFEVACLGGMYLPASRHCGAAGTYTPSFWCVKPPPFGGACRCVRNSRKRRACGGLIHFPRTHSLKLQPLFYGTPFLCNSSSFPAFSHDTAPYLPPR